MARQDSHLFPSDFQMYKLSPQESHMARKCQSEGSCFDWRDGWPHGPATQHRGHWAEILCSSEKEVTEPLKLVEVTIGCYVDW